MTDMEKARKVARQFTAEQKFEILKDIEKHASIKEGLDKHQLANSVYYKWKRQLEVGVRASLRSTKPLKAPDSRRLEAQNRTLKNMVLNLSHQLCELKKEMSLD
jgi:transposase-like protein